MVPTAEEFLNSLNIPKYEVTNADIEFAMIAFAKLHNEAQAKAIYEKGLSNLTVWSGNPYTGEGDDDLSLELIKEAYPLENIK